MAKGRALLRVFATLNLIAGALAVWGGAQEVFYRSGEASFGPMVGACGALTGVLLFASGTALWSRKRSGWRLAQWGGWTTIVVAAVGVAAGTMGLAGLIYWVAYPAVMMVCLRRDRGTPDPHSESDQEQHADAGDTDGLRRRTALA